MTASSLIGNLAVNLTLETAAFQKGATYSQKQLASVQKSFESTSKKITLTGGALLAGITAPLVAAAKLSVDGAKAQRAAMAQVETALASMGDVSGRTADQLLKASDALELDSLYDGDEILKKVTANLLTFGNVSGTVFDRAQQAALDLSARLGTDLQAATIMVGKALNDPVKGLSALRRVGIQFTEQQEAQIEAMVKVGNVAGAQSIMLKELERQYSGSAKAAADTEPWRRAQVILGQVGDTIGEKLLPYITQVAGAATAMLASFNELSPGAQDLAIGVAAAAAATGPLLLGLGAIVGAAGKLVPLLAGGAGLTGILVPLAAGVTAVYLAWQNWEKIGPWIDGVVERTTAATTEIDGYLAKLNKWADETDRRLGIPTKNEFFDSVAKNFAESYKRIDDFLKGVQKFADDFDAAFLRAANSIPKLYNSVKIWLSDKLNIVWDAVGAKIQWVADKFKWLDDVVVRNSYIPDMVDSIGDHMARLDGNMVKPAQKMTEEAARYFEQMQSRVASIMNRLFPDLALANTFKAELDAIDYAVKNFGLSLEAATKAKMKLRKEYDEASNIPMIGAVDDPTDLLPDMEPVWAGEIYGLKKALGDNLVDPVFSATVMVQQSFAQMADNVMNSLSRLVNGIKGGGFLDVLGGLTSLFSSLGQTGLFGSGIQSGLQKFNLDIFRAGGGPVSAGRAHIVGEDGPEWFTPQRSGTIIPNGAGGSRQAVHVTVDASPLLTARIDEGDQVASITGTNNALKTSARMQNGRL